MDKFEAALLELIENSTRLVENSKELELQTFVAHNEARKSAFVQVLEAYRKQDAPVFRVGDRVKHSMGSMQGEIIREYEPRYLVWWDGDPHVNQRAHGASELERVTSIEESEEAS